MPWNREAKFRSAGSRNGANPKQRMPSVEKAFASVPLAWLRETGADPARLNVNGGAIALGHPLGATGAMILGTLIDELERQDLRYGLATLCVGGGMGVATIVERIR